MPTANEELYSLAVKHQVGLLRYSTQTVRKIIALLNRVDARIVEELARRGIGDQSFTRRRLDLLLEAVRTIIGEAYGKATDTLDGELKDLASYEADFQKRMVLHSIPVNWDIITPSRQQLYAAVNARPFQGRYLKDWYKELETGAQQRLRNEIRMGFVEGRTTDQIVRAVRGTEAQQYKDGILEISRRGAEALIRTAVNHTATVARNQVYQENADLVKGVLWVSVLDGRTTAICRARDGKQYPLDKGPRPPAHINCRSTTTPILKSWKELGLNLKEAPAGTRASMNGQVPAEMTYSDWLAKQPKELQDEILGKTKAELWRKGDLPLDKFVDKSGHEYTLDELRRRESEAFKKAGL